MQEIDLVFLVKVLIAVSTFLLFCIVTLAVILLNMKNEIFELRTMLPVRGGPFGRALLSTHTREDARIVLNIDTPSPLKEYHKQGEFDELG